MPTLDQIVEDMVGETECRLHFNSYKLKKTKKSLKKIIANYARSIIPKEKGDYGPEDWPKIIQWLDEHKF